MEQNTNVISQQALARLGGRQIGYVRTIMSDDLPRLFPDAPEMEPGLRLFALHAADGTPILLTDSRESALAGAREHELEPLSVH